MKPKELTQGTYVDPKEPQRVFYICDPDVFYPAAIEFLRTLQAEMLAGKQIGDPHIRNILVQHNILEMQRSAFDSAFVPASIVPDKASRTHVLEAARKVFTELLARDHGAGSIGIKILRKGNWRLS